MRKPVSMRRQKKSSAKEIAKPLNMDQFEKNSRGEFDMNHNCYEPDVENVDALKFLNDSETGPLLYKSLLDEIKSEQLRSFNKQIGLEEKLEKLINQQNTISSVFSQIEFEKKVLLNQFGVINSKFDKLIDDKNKEQVTLVNDALLSFNNEKNLILSQFSNLNMKIEELFETQKENCNVNSELKNQNLKMIQSLEAVVETFNMSEVMEETKNNKLDLLLNQLRNDVKYIQNVESNLNYKEENELLLNQLHIIQEEFEKLLLDRNENKENTVKDIETKNIYYGAAKRVKQELPYRLGATMIAHSRDINGLLTLPYALILENKNYKNTSGNVGSEPDIEEYGDAYEAERVKQHLSYELGSIMLDNSKTLKGWIGLPLAMHKAVQNFKKKQSNK